MVNFINDRLIYHYNIVLNSTKPVIKMIFASLLIFQNLKIVHLFVMIQMKNVIKNVEINS